MPKQTKKTASETEQIVPTPESVESTIVVESTPSSSSNAEPKKRGRKPKSADSSLAPGNKPSKKDVAAAAAATIMLHAKRPSTDYLFFCEEIRPQIMKENPTMSFRDVGSEQGRRWKALPQEAKNVYKQRWEADKKRYEEDLAIVEKNRAEHPDLFAVQKKQRKQKSKPLVKRGMTAFILFCKEQRPVLRQSDPNIKFGETGARLGQMWKSMTEEQKAKYVALSQEDVKRAERERQALKEQGIANVQVSPATEPKKRGRKPKAAVETETDQAKSSSAKETSAKETSAKATSAQKKAGAKDDEPKVAKPRGRKPKQEVSA